MHGTVDVTHPHTNNRSNSMSKRSYLISGASRGIRLALAHRLQRSGRSRANSPLGSVNEAPMLSIVPMARFGRPDEIAVAIAFPLSEDAIEITGQTLQPDGGASIVRRAA
jgi:NAD(P)-dependent dehydrogenase (short-subunit alcohol dehydrogenase family)